MPGEATPNKTDPKVVQAKPTKEFFIRMLTRDIDLKAAIADLIDNSVDAARGLRKARSLDGLEISITVKADRFSIVDNCGGMSAFTARNYAFCFGRPEGAPHQKHSVGRFGVGMKRALFKIGRNFEIASTAAKSTFRLDIDVDAWQRSDEWEFRFKALREGATSKPPLGTSIQVSRLHQSVSEKFANPGFIAELRQDIGFRHSLSIAHGMTITLNEEAVPAAALTVLESAKIQSFTRSAKLSATGSKTPIKLRVVAGVEDSNPSRAGWYVFCNGRLVLAADQTSLTGWGDTRGTKLPKYHNQYARFRGYAFFDSDESDLLPWDTTKTTLSADSEVYVQASSIMTASARQVFDFLDAIKAERSENEGVSDDADPGPLEQAARAATRKTVTSIKRAETTFAAPQRPAKPRVTKKTVSIQYSKERSRADRLMEALGADSYRAAGDIAFEMAYDEVAR